MWEELEVSVVDVKPMISVRLNVKDEDSGIECSEKIEYFSTEPEVIVRKALNATLDLLMRMGYLGRTKEKT
jgi:hypothetical protein